MKRLAVGLLLVVGLTLVAPAVARADTVIAAGRSITEITVAGEDVTLNGTSEGSVIVIGGDLSIGPQGRAMQGVTVIGGRLTTTPGAQIHGDVLQLGATIPHPAGWVIAATALGLLAARSALAWLIVRIARLLAQWQTTSAVLQAARVRPLRTSAVGALMTAGLLAAAILLALTVIGLVFAAALLGLLVLAAAFGVSFALTGPLDSDEQTRTVALTLAFPIVGDALLALAAIVAIGALFHYLIDERTPRTAPPVLAP